MALRALVVEDEPDLALAVRLHLEAEGFDVDEAGDGDAAVLSAREGRYDVILLDLRLPKRDGIDVLRTIRGAGDRTPVVCVTARAEERDRVLGLDLGADDYVTKPFSSAELMARVRAVLRRTGRARREGEVELGDVTLLLDERAALVRGERVGLTATEAQILNYLSARDGAVVDRAKMLRDLWGLDETASTRTLDNHVARVGICGRTATVRGWIRILSAATARRTPRPRRRGPSPRTHRPRRSRAYALPELRGKRSPLGVLEPLRDLCGKTPSPNSDGPSRRERYDSGTRVWRAPASHGAVPTRRRP